MSDDGAAAQTADREVKRWRRELDRAKRTIEDDFDKTAKRLIKRYRGNKGSEGRKGALFNIFWSNIQTLLPAIYARAPKPIIGRRFLDKDPIGRIACRLLERTVTYQVEASEFEDEVKLAVRDWAMLGRGVAWVLYSPEFEREPMPEDTGGNIDASPPGEQDDDDAEPAEDPNPAEQAQERIVWEMCRVMHVHRRDFRHGPGRTWREVPWVARGAYMTAAELKDRFGPAAEGVPLNFSAELDDEAKPQRATEDDDREKALVWEIWDKSRKCVHWIAEDHPTVLDYKEDPLRLPNFFPTPRPLLANLVGDDLIPVADFEQYVGLANDVETLTKRIARLAKACKVKGVYDNSIPELARLLDELHESEMIGVKDWGSFSESRGLAGKVDWLPIEIFAKALPLLHEAREQAKQELFEISGMSDIMRGQGDSGETATGVKTKSHFATLRLQSMQAEVARYNRDLIEIIAHIVCELFQPEIIAEMASAQEMDELMIDVPAPAAGPGSLPPSPRALPVGAGAPMLGHNGGPPGPLPGAM